MTDLFNGEIKDIMPVNLLTPESEAVSFAVSQALKKQQIFSDSSLLLAGIGHVPDAVLNLLAVEFNTQYYDQSLPRKTRETLVARTISWYMRAGTVSVLEEFLGTVLNGGKITEWFEYDGDPYCFIADVDVGECEIPLNYGKQVMHQINIYKNLRSYLQSLIFRYRSIYTVPINYENRLTLEMEFYPRYNMAYHYLEGAHLLDGNKELNGYAADKILDFYPTVLDVTAHVVQATEAAAILGIQSDDKVKISASAITGAGSGVGASPGSVVGVTAKAQIQVIKHAEAQAVLRPEAYCRTEAVSQEVRIGSDAVEKSAAGTEIHFTFDGRVSVSTAGSLLVEDHLRYLDGSGYLDGNGYLNADTYTYKL